MKQIAVLLAGFVCLGALNGVAGGTEKVNPYTVALSKVAVPELPAKAAELVKAAKAPERSLTAAEVVKAAFQANHAAVFAVVSSICKAAPETAAVAAGTAAQLQPKYAVLIAKVAAKAAPSEAAQIVVAVARVVPRSYRLVATTVSDAVPGSNQAILAALAAAFPELAGSIQKSLANYTGQSPSLAQILDPAIAVTVAVPSAPGVRGPSENPGYPSGNGITSFGSANNDPQVPVPYGGAGSTTSP